MAAGSSHEDAVHLCILTLQMRILPEFCATTIEKEQRAFDRLTAELGRAFAAQESADKALSAADVIARNATGA